MKQMKYKKQIQLIAAIVTLIVFPVITFYLMEAYTHNPFEEVRPWAQFFNILLFELLAWIFVSVTGKIQSGLSPLASAAAPEMMNPCPHKFKGHGFCVSIRFGLSTNPRFDAH